MRRFRQDGAGTPPAPFLSPLLVAACRGCHLRSPRCPNLIQLIMQKVLIDGQWPPAQQAGSFRAENPATREPLPEQYPISSWADCDVALKAAAGAAAQLRQLPATRLADFLDRFAQRIE